jgi:LmbE family N-acetylglucosaminyl deacetylase
VPISRLRRLLRSSRASARFYLELLRFGERPRVVEPPVARQVVVLAPHPDDEAIGCGGVIRLYALAGTPVAIVYLTDGSRGDRESADAGSAELAARRKEEARQAAAVLGCSELSFLDLPDGQLEASQQNVDRLAAVLDRLQPDLVLLPFLIDQHLDHFQTNALFVAAASRLDAGRVECWGYEVWTPVYANRLVDITAVAEAKWQALRLYESQGDHLDYVASTMGLNAFRQRAAYRPSGYAEAFFAASLEEYRDLYRQASQSRSPH